MQNSLSGEILPQLKHTTYPIKSPKAAFAQIAEIVIVVSPKLCTMYAILADCSEALVACPCAGYACSLSTNATPTSDLVLFDYRTT
jgi:hypothetical protein